MKFRITFKDPDGVYESLREEARSSIPNTIDDEHTSDFSEKELEILVGSRKDTMREFISPWIEYGEYVTIEFDTEENTAMVVKS